MTETMSVQTDQDETLDDKRVVEYLKNNAGLLDRNPDVLSQLSITHETGSAVSLVERQIKLLREENKHLKSKLSDLIHIARENEELSQRFHRLSLELMSGEHLHDILAMTRDQVRTFFYTDHVSFCFHDARAGQLQGLENSVLDSDSKHAAKLKRWMHERKPVFGPFDQGVNKLLLDEERLLSSCALIPLYHTEEIGLLVLGSKSKDRFIEGMGTVFLSQLGELISSKLKNYLF